MMRACALLLSAFMAGEALAGAPLCTSLDKAQKAAGKGTAIAPLTPAQFHFLQGFWVALPTTPEGLPPGDGALLLTKDGEKDGLILWTRGVLACAPMAAPEKLIELLHHVKAGIGSEGDAL